MDSNIFWITNGVGLDDEYRVVQRTSLLGVCNHCYARTDGFKYMGKPMGYGYYFICKKCMYKPSIELLRTNFISVSKTKNPDNFNELLNKCENKEAYDSYVLHV